ncbi:translocation/assembly module TamB domain-containing protein, partial [Balneolaceae bacterium ANBcel3]|nr:translocation/assembly module TamB domain-containing protein [Balneolaceae bacterium ANBcel3]
AESVISSGEASIETQSEVNWGQDDLEYSLKTILAHADLSVLPGLEHLATDISGIIELKGAGTEPEKMLLSGNLDFNRSVINGQRFETAKMDFRLEDGWLEIEDGRISGSSADASLFLRQHILEPANMDNRMRFQLELKDVSGFANLAGAEEFQVLGEIGGRIRPDERGDLVVKADVALRDVVYDSITVHRVHGKAAVLLSEVMEYIADLEIQDPSYGAYSMTDIRFIAAGTIDEEVISGSYDFRFNVEAESGLRTRANYTFDGQAGDILVHQLDLRDPAGAYSLKKPLSITMAPGSIQADTLILISNTGSEFIMNIEQESHSRWSGFIESREADLGQAQYVFLEEPFFEALFSGRVEFSFDTDDINLIAKAELSGFRHSYIELDTIKIDTEILNKELEGALLIWKNEALLMQSAWSIPFDPGMLEQPDAEWLDQAVYASIQIEPVSLADFSDIMEMMGLEDLRGRFSMNSTLSGTAGVPELEGQLYLHNGRVSGVQMDTLQASWAYNHEHGGLRLTSRIHTMGQIAADIQANIPLHIDIPNRTAAGPEQDDAIEASIFTDNFNLAAFNDFLDPGVIRGLQGRLNAEVDISGKVSEPLIRGQVELSEGQFRLVENNVTIRQIESVVRMTPEEIVLERFSAQSSGSLEGSGRISMEGLEPGALQLGFRANNFRVFNTRDIEIFAGLNITLSGSLEAPLLAGNVIWERGTIFLDGFGERDIEVVQLEGEEDISDIPDFFDRLEMDMTFMVDRNAFVRTRRDPEIFLAPRGEIDLVKEPYGELQLFGDMGISSGHVTTFNKRFRLERGDVQFSGDPMDPEMNIRTLYRPRQQYEDIHIYFNITGTLSDPEFTYDSDPEMELQDIISYTLFGRPFHALAGWEQTVTGRSDGSLATNIALDILLDRIETLAADRLGIDVIEIESSNQRGSGGTTIKAGKFVSDRLFVAFLQELGGSDAGMQMMIEYMIRRNLDLIITAGDDYRSGVDVLWRFDY